MRHQRRSQVRRRRRTIDDQTVDVTDDDTADVVVADERTRCSTRPRRHDRQPSRAPRIAAARRRTSRSTTPDGQTTTDVPTLTFTPINWADDADRDRHGRRRRDRRGGSTRRHDRHRSLTSGDALYDAIDPDDVTADIADDDVAGVTSPRTPAPPTSTRPARPTPTPSCCETSRPTT